MKSIRSLAFTIAALTLLAAAPRSALGTGSPYGAGWLDPSFGGGGVVINPVGSGGARGTGVAVQKDGKIVVAGYADGTNGNPNFAVARYQVNGALDTSFGTGNGSFSSKGGGIALSPIPGGNAQGTGIALQADGKILVVGYVQISGITEFALARYTTAGTLDPTFGKGGWVLTPVGNEGYSIGYAVAVQSDGKIVVGGVALSGSCGYSFAVVRYTMTGALDNTFGTGGIMTAQFWNSTDSFAYALALQSDGKIVLGGYSYTNACGYSFALARFTAAGALDGNFGSWGKVTTPVGSYGDAAVYGIAVQANGGIVAVGQATDVYDDYNFALARYTPAGCLDTNFGSSGIVLDQFGDGDSYASSVVLQPDGKIVVAGSGNDDGDTFVVARYIATGSLDGSFGDGGVTITQASPYGNSSGNALALQPNGSIVVAGQAYYYYGFGFGVARYFGAPPATSYGSR